MAAPGSRAAAKPACAGSWPFSAHGRTWGAANPPGATSREHFAHDLLRRLESLVLVEADGARVAGRDVELDDRLSYAIRPLVGAVEQGLGKPAAMPCVFHVERL